MAAVKREVNGGDTPPKDALRDSVARFGERRRRWRREQTRALAVALSVMGTGWMIVVPALAGFVIGRWLDDRLHTGVAMSAAAGLLGLCLGCYAAWRWIWRNRPEPGR